ncbi:hypothetical protein JG687_00019717 [Phytophthora cactorum]|uniref:Uncharacterized protein n=1 Tax=Phytophthora cactorum TaxID=29920 RepID=A0A8T1TM98_9STRA|nr:hypothetical protein GQ600_17856 [Phytophthora cactorum]KAF1784068.1 hypothetical protein GQ600_17859 [Phytophthora cactorum]KAG6941340.1 hypothetical protein JG687_00019717 [Phytophthora cactorum]
MCFTNMVIASQLFAGEVAASPRSRSRCERCESMRLICGAQNASCGIWPIRLRPRVHCVQVTHAASELDACFGGALGRCA